MTRADLEAAIWHALQQHGATVPATPQFMHTVLAAADAYAQHEVCAERRRILAGIPGDGPAVHYGEDAHACRTRSNGEKLAATLNPARVTCARCKHTRAYAAARLGVAS